MILQQYVERAPEPLIGSGSKDPISQAISMSMDLDQDLGLELNVMKDLEMNIVNNWNGSADPLIVLSQVVRTNANSMFCGGFLIVLKTEVNRWTVFAGWMGQNLLHFEIYRFCMQFWSPL